MEKIVFLLIRLVITFSISLLEQGDLSKWDLKSVSEPILLAFIVEIGAIIASVNDIYFRYRNPSIFWNLIRKIQLKLIERNITASISQTDLKEYNRQLILIALDKVASKDDPKKRLGITQLYYFDQDKDPVCADRIYKSLIKAYYREDNSKFKPLLMDVICRYEHAQWVE
jgi:hypothetical protein